MEPWFTQPVRDVAAALDTDLDQGLTSQEAAARLASVGANEIAGEPPPSVLQVALLQLRDPMNLMLVGVAAVSLVIGQWSTAALIAALVVLNVAVGARQELAARASIDALSQLQVPAARVVRDGTLTVVPAPELVPGDVVNLEAGDLVPADGRIARSATLEVQEAALTGESAPVSKDAHELTGPDTAVGDQSNMLFQNTSVTRGTATMLVTGTGMKTQMGQIATMLSGVKRSKSPLQAELDSLTKVLGIIAWSAVLIIVLAGLARDLPIADVLLLATAMAISAIPTGMPTFVMALLSSGAKQLAEAKAVVKNLTDVETLGATSAINTDKTGTLTLNEMMVSDLYTRDGWFHVEGEGYRKVGAVLATAGREAPDFTPLAYGLTLASDATVSDAGEVIGDPTEAALVVLAAKLGVDTEGTRRTYPRVAEVPFDSEYKFMATAHRLPIGDTERLVLLVKGGPDVVLARCGSAGKVVTGEIVPIDQRQAEIEDANLRLGEQGLRVLSFAARILDDADEPALLADPMSFVTDLTFVALVGIIDPLRPSSKDAVRTALSAGIEVRMITGDHAVTARAIGEQLGLGSGAISGAELQGINDEELATRLPQLHVFGRVSPEDKLRLAQVMQREGDIVAMTGDAVNDAAALKAADIGVAMGSGAEVSKQSARMILTDDNFGTLVHAVELGRRVYDKITAYIQFQMSQLVSLIALFLGATIFNINGGVAMTPLMVLYLNFFVTLFSVFVIGVDPGDPDVMKRPPRDPKEPLANRRSVLRWALYGMTIFAASLVPLLWGPGRPSPDQPSAAMTMTFAVVGFSTVLSAIVMRRNPASGLVPPLLQALRISAVPLGLILLATELPLLQRALMTQPLTVDQWLAVVGLSLVCPVVVEVDKWVQRRKLVREPLEPRHAVAPDRALVSKVAA